MKITINELTKIFPNRKKGGADVVAAKTALRSPIQVDVVGHDHMGIAGDEEAFRGNACFLQQVHLLAQDPRIHHAAIADDRNRVLIHAARGNQMQFEGGVAMDDRMARIVAALRANAVIELPCKKVGDLAFTLVAPLRAHKNNSSHYSLLRYIKDYCLSLPKTLYDSVHKGRRVSFLALITIAM